MSFLKKHILKFTVNSLNLHTDAYDASHMTYKWKKKPGIKITDRKMAQFQLIKFETVGKLEVYAAG